MIHVSDVGATVEWYRGIGFAVHRSNVDCGEMNWALLSLDGAEVMFSAGGRSSSEHRREMDLYIHCDDVEARFARLKTRAEVVEGLHDTEYGMREFIIRDPNRFWLTFGQRV